MDSSLWAVRALMLGPLDAVCSGVTGIDFEVSGRLKSMVLTLLRLPPRVIPVEVEREHRRSQTRTRRNEKVMVTLGGVFFDGNSRPL
eukprot:3474760-Amphidinium_carterae.1